MLCVCVCVCVTEAACIQKNFAGAHLSNFFDDASQLRHLERVLAHLLLWMRRVAVGTCPTRRPLYWVRCQDAWKMQRSAQCRLPSAYVPPTSSLLCIYLRNIIDFLVSVASISVLFIRMRIAALFWCDFCVRWQHLLGSAAKSWNVSGDGSQQMFKEFAFGVGERITSTSPAGRSLIDNDLPDSRTCYHQM